MAITVVVAACSDNPASPGSGSSTPDVAALLAEMSPSSMQGAATAVAPAAGVMLSMAPAIDPRSCVYSADTGFFVCPTIVRDGVTLTRMFRLIDAAGNTQSKPDAQTSAIETKTTVRGTPTSPPGAPSLGPLSIDGASDMTLSGIRTDKHLLNGTSTMTMTSSYQVNGTTIPITTSMKETTSNLQLPNAKAGQKWPGPGTITIDETTNLLSVNGSTTPEVVHIVMTFDGTSKVTVTFTDRFGTSTCTFDMAQPGLAGSTCS